MKVLTFYTLLHRKCFFLIFWKLYWHMSMFKSDLSTERKLHLMGITMVKAEETKSVDLDIVCVWGGGGGGGGKGEW